MPSLATTPEVSRLIESGAPIVIGVSGGKDSCATAFAVSEHLDAVGHSGPRVLIHSDLGRVEWKDSLPTCERLAAATGLELMVVRRQAGDMMDRWLTRWRNNVERYAALSCVQLILPWSTPAMRFCTSELKTAVICSALVKRFPGQQILSVSGIRRDESTAREKSPIVKEQPKLTSATHKTRGYDWHPLLDWTQDDVFGLAEAHGFPMHEAYERYGASRVSCCFCIMSSAADLTAAAGCEDNHDVYREMVGLEAESTFAFQGGKWLGDVAPQLLGASLRDRLTWAKTAAERRQAAEARIPAHLLYTKGWPTCLPTRDEARLLAEVRNEVAEAVGLSIECTTPGAIIARYQELLDEKDAKSGARFSLMAG